MTQEALQELAGQLPSDSPQDAEAIRQIGEALQFLKAESRREYEEQRAEIEANRELAASL